ncbi:uncharacterized protein JCM15063_005899 [Sporobolomyces koalae]|uniref:uncharacterized protein n=1 Tax=Sporobolomyces koalae TaxID=500713 RepID=UPI0031824EAF
MMHRIRTQLTPVQIGRYSRCYSRAPQIEVDDLCLPLSSPYTLSSLLPTVPSPLTNETLDKLHRLSALLPPSSSGTIVKDYEDSKHLEGLSELVQIVETVRSVDTSSLGLEPGQSIDARVRAKSIPIDLFESSSNAPTSDERYDQFELWKLAKRHQGRFFVAQMPDNVRTRKQPSSGIDHEDSQFEPID